MSVLRKRSYIGLSERMERVCLYLLREILQRSKKYHIRYSGRFFLSLKAQNDLKNYQSFQKYTYSINYAERSSCLISVPEKTTIVKTERNFLLNTFDLREI